MRVLISGAGIAGPTVAYWLDYYGLTPTIVEHAPRLRTGGYPVDFWGAGFDVADRMGLAPELRETGYMVHELRVVNRSGKRIAGFPMKSFFSATKGKYVTIPRGELSRAIFGKIAGRVETIFGDSITRMEQTRDKVQVTFASGAEREFDLVVGADGLHSRVRELAFGPEDRWERYLGYKVAAFEVPGYRPRDELVYLMFTELGQQVGRFTMRDDRTMFLFTFADAQPDNGMTGGIQGQKELLRQKFGKSGWECPQILKALEGAGDLYFDRVSQIRMDAAEARWARGRVVLIGDAASCVSLLAGEGSGLAMTAAYILAGELHRAGGDHEAAFARYESLFADFVREKQEGALRLAGTFAPKTKLSMFVRNQVMNLLRVPWIADILLVRTFADRIVIPAYEHEAAGPRPSPQHVASAR